MPIPRDKMDCIIKSVIEDLHIDLVYHEWFVQTVASCNEERRPSQAEIAEILRELLQTGEVEIGRTERKPDYLEFIAWRGTVDERVKRAMTNIDSTRGLERAFCYWLCLRKNIDRYEDTEESLSSPISSFGDKIVGELCHRIVRKQERRGLENERKQS